MTTRNRPTGWRSAWLGNAQILWVSPAQLWRAAVLTSIFLVAWFRFRARLGHAGFYVLFALMVAMSVQMMGVYLVFSTLIMPALATHRMPVRRQLMVGHALCAGSYVAGLWLSLWLDWPSGALIVWTMAVMGTVTHLVSGRSGSKEHLCG